MAGDLCGELGAVGDPELAQCCRDVAFDGFARHEQPLGDLRVCEALPDQPRDLPLGRSEAVPAGRWPAPSAAASSHVGDGLVGGQREPLGVGPVERLDAEFVAQLQLECVEFLGAGFPRDGSLLVPEAVDRPEDAGRTDEIRDACGGFGPATRARWPARIGVRCR